MDSIKKFMASKPVESGMQLLTIVMAIVSIISCRSAYYQLKSASVDFAGIADNWNTKPLMYVNVTSDSSCPDGMEAVPAIEWKGLSEGWCACSVNAAHDGYAQVSSTSSCNTNQTAAGCVTDPSLPGLEFEYFLGQKTCIKRGGEAAVKSYSPFVKRPSPDSTNFLCDSTSGYKKCGINTYTSDRAICWPTYLDCPVTGLNASDLTLAESLEKLNFTYDPSNTDYEFYDNSNSATNYQLFYGQTQIDRLPIVDFQMAFAANQKVDASGPCYNVNQQQNEFSSASTWTGTAADPQISLGNPSSCDTYDTRYEQYATESEYDLFLDNFSKLSDCSGKDLYTNEYNYLEGGSQCSGDCACPECEDLNCGSDDDICKNMQRQSKCGKYQMIAQQAKNNGKSIGMYYRPQIYWKASCAADGATKLEVNNAIEPLETTVNAQYALMILNIIANTIAGIIFPLLMCYNIIFNDVPCVAGKGKEEKALLTSRKNNTSFVLQIVKITPLVITIVLISRISDFFTVLAQQSCSDSITNETISELSTTLPSVKEANTTTLATDIVTMLITISSCIFSGKDEEEEEEEHANATQNPAMKQLEMSHNTL